MLTGVYLIRVVLSEAVDWCICFIRKIQHGGDWERSPPQGPKNVHNFLMTVQPLSRASGHGTEILQILKKHIFDRIIQGHVKDMTLQRNVPRLCTGSICGWNCFIHWGYRVICLHCMIITDILFILIVLMECLLRLKKTWWYTEHCWLGAACCFARIDGPCYFWSVLVV